MRASEWNAQYPVGTRVRYWPVIPASTMFPSIDTQTRSEAWELGGGHVVVAIHGKSGGVHIGHIEVIE